MLHLLSAKSEMNHITPHLTRPSARATGRGDMSTQRVN